MNRELVLTELATLPPTAQEQVMDFIAFLRTRYAPARVASRARPATATLAEEPFIGLWRNRQDMQDSSAWVRTTRQREWAAHE